MGKIEKVTWRTVWYTQTAAKGLVKFEFPLR